MKTKAQAIIEFTLAFICAILFLILSCNLFVWMNHCMVGRQVGYENSRVDAGHSNPGNEDFYTPPTLHVFSSGGR